MSDLSGANLAYSNLTSANFQSANLRDVDLEQTVLDDADLTGADLSGIKWKNIAAIEGAVIRDVRNAPVGFVAWALAHKAVLIEGGPK
jgi:uncharacterized protein YjbI with pentapeptide repeats